jgi:hypothetical protein
MEKVLGWNNFLAKLANPTVSSRDHAGQSGSLYRDHPVAKFHGVGPKTAAKISALCI